MAPIDLDSLDREQFAATGGPQFAAPMISDLPSGGCGTLTIEGQVFSIEHPNFACGRLNYAENGSPFLQNRAFFSYRHFEGAVETDVILRAVTDIDRFIFGFEKTMLNGCVSFELRVPFNYQLDSDINIGIDNSTDTLTNIPIDAKNFELGFVAMAFKALLLQDENRVATGGLGVTLPTARAVAINVNFVNLPIQGMDRTGMISSLISNETVYLTPFVAAAYSPDPWWFAQGFLQIDIPLSPTRGTVGVDDQTVYPPNNPPDNNLDFAGSGSLSWQTLLRLNAQIGRWLYQSNDCQSWLRRLGVVAEVNWTSTLNDAELMEFRDIGGLEIDVVLGNVDNRVDIVNATVGLVADAGKWNFNVGFIMPVSQGSNRAYDWELAMIANRRF